MGSKIGIIIQREFNERVKKKSFIITTILTPLFMIALMFAPALISTYSGGDTKHIAVVDESGYIAGQLMDNEELVFEETKLPLEIARKELSDCFAILYIGEDIEENPGNIKIYNNEATSFAIEQNITVQVGSIVQNKKLEEQNISNLTQILQETRVDITPQSFRNTAEEAETQDDSSIVSSVLAYVLSFILYMFLIIYGVMVMQSVIEEKNSRVLEVMVSSVSPFQLMMGKILGVASVAIVQIALWALLITGLVYFVLPEVLPDQILEAMALMKQGVPASEIPGGTELGMIQALGMLSDVGYIGGIMFTLLIFFFGGFLLYAAMFAAVGSSVDNPQDAQQLQTPIMMPIIISIMVMLSVINDPTSDVSFWFSMIPFTSPIVMMARIPYGIPTWEIVVSAIVLYATFLIVVYGASKIYRVGILMHGKKPSLKELWKWMRYK